MSITRRRALAVCAFAAIPLFLGGAGLSWNVNISSPVTSPGKLTVTVNGAPAFAVEVEILCDGNLVKIGNVASAGGSVTWTIPPEKSGAGWEVRLTDANGQRWGDTGTIM